MLRLAGSTLSAGGVTLLAVGSLMLGGCGQQGALYLPTDAAAANRATLPQTLLPKTLTHPAASTLAPAVSPAPAASSARP